MSFFRIVFSLICAGILGGCGSVGLLTTDDRVNVAVGSMYTTMDRFGVLSGRVKAGEKIDRQAALLALGIHDERHATVASLSRAEIQTYLFGGSSFFAGDTKVIDLLDHTTGVRIPFTGRQERIVVANGVYFTTNETGYDFSIVLIFRDGVIRDADQIGVLSLNRSTKKIIWNPASGLDGPANLLLRR